MSRMNRMHNMTNPAQGRFKRVLCICSAGLLRSPTAAVVLSQPPFDFNTRAAGIVADYALVVVDEFLCEWSDEVVCMTKEQEEIMRDSGYVKPIHCLDIPDDFEYRDPKLMQMIAAAYKAKTGYDKEL